MNIRNNAGKKNKKTWEWKEKHYFNSKSNDIEYWYCIKERACGTIAFLIRPVEDPESEDGYKYMVMSVTDVRKASDWEAENPLYKYKNTGGYLLNGIQTIHSVKNALEDAKQDAQNVFDSMNPVQFFNTL